MHRGGVQPVSISSPGLVSPPESYGGVLHTWGPTPELPQPLAEDTAGTGRSHLTLQVKQQHSVWRERFINCEAKGGARNRYPQEEVTLKISKERCGNGSSSLPPVIQHSKMFLTPDTILTPGVQIALHGLSGEKSILTTYWKWKVGCVARGVVIHRVRRDSEEHQV